MRCALEFFEGKDGAARGAIIGVGDEEEHFFWNVH